MGWKNLMSPVSEASPVVGMSNQSFVLSSLSHLAFYYLIFYYFSSSVIVLLLLMALLFSEGKDLSKLATEQITAVSCIAVNPSSFMSY
jgi:hypothetical protein